MWVMVAVTGYDQQVRGSRKSWSGKKILVCPEVCIAFSVHVISQGLEESF